MLDRLLEKMRREPVLAPLFALQDGQTVALYNLCPAQRPLIAAALSRALGRPVMTVSQSGAAAARIASDADALLGGQGICVSLGGEDILFTRAVAGQENQFQRLDVLSRMRRGQVAVLSVSADALTTPLMPAGDWWSRRMTVRPGDRMDPEGLTAQLCAMGYRRVDLVEGKGQCARRGDIVDVYPPDMETAVRIEFFDDEADILRTFDPMSQRSLERVEEVCVIPAALFVDVPPEKAEVWRTLIRNQLEKGGRWVNPAPAENVEKGETGAEDGAEEGKAALPDVFGDQTLAFGDTLRRTLDDADALAAGALPAALPLWATALGLPCGRLQDYFDRSPIVLLDGPEAVRERCEDRRSGFEEDFRLALERGDAVPAQEGLVGGWEQVLSALQGDAVVTCQDFLRGMAGLTPTALVDFPGHPAVQYFSRMGDLKNDLERWRKAHYLVALCAGGVSRGERLRETLAEMGVTVPEGEETPEEGLVIRKESLSQGMESPLLRVAVVADGDLFGTGYRRRRSAPARTLGRKIEAFTDLTEGDYVVHESHGVGIFKGTVRLQSEGAWRDYLLIQYQGNDKLYVPTEQFDRIQKFIGGGEDKAPQLNSLNSGAWDRQKKKVRDSLKKLAFDLVQLYAARQQEPGFSFAPDTPWQRQFEDAFPYELTPDQQTAVADIKADMERPVNMDRLLCGDVGYGKTEVALRAAFKCVMSGKQAAILCPTTILAQQHFYTLQKRMADFPVQADVVSRMRPPKTQRETLRRLAEGKVDILVGTHKLLGKDVRFKDLGLLIIDEEQRFGVAHKEQIKNLKKQVDVLTLSATPIPRTLHMSMVGVRDMSLLTTPPEERLPVQTYVMDYSDGVVRDAVLREVGRGGQVYFLYNQVQHIDAFAGHLRRLLPGVRITVAHGQMKEGQLEDAMLDFYDQRSDVLLCSTIIENGLDVPNANTIIVYDADCFGLSQLYQLRGRVGRSTRAAFAYFTVRPDRSLSETAQKRLQAIREFTAFGSGFRIAMRDLEIRGAGNIFGPEQSGNVATVGYELYCKMIEEAVREAAPGGAAVSEDSLPDTRVELKIDAYLPAEYVRDEGQRMEVFRRISFIRSRADREDVIEELIDRFGDVPPQVMNLIDVSHLRALCRRLCVSRVTWQAGALVMRLEKGAPVEKMYPLLAEADKRLLFSAGRDAALLLRDGRLSVAELMRQAVPVLEKIVAGVYPSPGAPGQNAGG